MSALRRAAPVRVVPARRAAPVRAVSPRRAAPVRVASGRLRAAVRETSALRVVSVRAMPLRRVSNAVRVELGCTLLCEASARVTVLCPRIVGVLAIERPAVVVCGVRVNVLSVRIVVRGVDTRV